jgi:molybdopterin molybdotransferase
MSHHHLEPFDAYRRRVLARVAPLAAREVQLAEARGLVLAEAVTAATPLPPFDNTAMDGYAVRADEAVAGAGLPVTAEVAAGDAGDRPVEPGTAAAIMTGAPVPPGADAVVPVEEAHEDGEAVEVRVAPKPGAHIRRAGEDVAAGDVALAPGTRLGAAELGLAAAAGRATVSAHPRPRVAVVPTGDELAASHQPLGPGQIHDANGPALAAAAAAAGGDVVQWAPPRDEPDAIRGVLADAVAGADLLVTTGGVSVGRDDHVGDVLAELGDVAGAAVAMQPGKPQAFGLVDGRPCFGLPGNPVSALTSFEMLVRPVLLRLAGHPDRARPRVPAVTEGALPGGKQRLRLVLVTLTERDGQVRVATPGTQGSHLLHGAAGAQAVVAVPPGHRWVEAGTAVDAWLLEGIGWLDGQRVAAAWTAGAWTMGAP